MPVMTAEQIERQLASYSMPVARLLTLDGASDEDLDNDTNYAQQFGINDTHQLELERMLCDPCFWELIPYHPANMAPTHAWRALIQMNNPAAIPALIAYLCDDNDEVAFEELPAAIGAFGAIAMPMTLTALERKYDNEYIASALLRVLFFIAKADANTRAVVIDHLEKIVANRRPDFELARASASLQLADLGSVTSLPTIKQAFDDEVIDEGYCSLKAIEQHLRDSTALKITGK